MLRVVGGLKWSSGTLKAEVVDENTLWPISGSDLVCVCVCVCVPNVVVFSPAVFANIVTSQTDKQLIN